MERSLARSILLTGFVVHLFAIHVHGQTRGRKASRQPVLQVPRPTNAAQGNAVTRTNKGKYEPAKFRQKDIDQLIIFLPKLRKSLEEIQSRHKTFTRRWQHFENLIEKIQNESPKLFVRERAIRSTWGHAKSLGKANRRLETRSRGFATFVQAINRRIVSNSSITIAQAESLREIEGWVYLRQRSLASQNRQLDKLLSVLEQTNDAMVLEQIEPKRHQWNSRNLSMDGFVDIYRNPGKSLLRDREMVTGYTAEKYYRDLRVEMGYDAPRNPAKMTFVKQGKTDWQKELRGRAVLLTRVYHGYVYIHSLQIGTKLADSLTVTPKWKKENLALWRRRYHKIVRPQLTREMRERIYALAKQYHPGLPNAIKKDLTMRMPDNVVLKP